MLRHDLYAALCLVSHGLQPEQYAARRTPRSSPGQSSMFDSDAHPRAASGEHGGEFVRKGTPATQADEPFTLANPAPKPKQTPINTIGGRQQALIDTRGKAGQMGLFAEAGQPEELTNPVFREAKSAPSTPAVKPEPKPAAAPASPAIGKLTDAILNRPGYHVTNGDQAEQMAQEFWFNSSEARKAFKDRKAFGAAVRAEYEGRGKAAVAAPAKNLKAAGQLIRASGKKLPKRDELIAHMGETVTRDEAEQILIHAGFGELESRDKAYDLAEKSGDKISAQTIAVVARSMYSENDRTGRLAEAVKAAGDAPVLEFRKPGSEVGFWIHPAAHAEHKGEWQITRFDEMGPSGHQYHKTKEEAIGSAIGAHPKGPYWDEGDHEFQLVGSQHARHAEPEPEEPGFALKAKPKARTLFSVAAHVSHVIERMRQYGIEVDRYVVDRHNAYALSHLERFGLLPDVQRYAAPGNSPGQRSLLGPGGRGERRPEKQRNLRWVTIGGSPGESGQHEGGRPVQIDGEGNIHKGAEWATSKGASNVKHLGGEERQQSQAPPQATPEAPQPPPQSPPRDRDAEHQQKLAAVPVVSNDEFATGAWDAAHAGLASEVVARKIAVGMEGIEGREYGIRQHSPGKWQLVSKPGKAAETTAPARQAHEAKLRELLAYWKERGGDRLRERVAELSDQEVDDLLDASRKLGQEGDRVVDISKDMGQIQRWVGAELLGSQRERQKKKQTQPAATPAAQAPPPKPKRELSDQEQADRDFAQNATDVAADPTKATSRNLHRAIGYQLHYARWVRHRAEKGEMDPKAAAEHEQSAKTEAEWYGRILKERGDYAGGGPYSDENETPSQHREREASSPQPQAPTAQSLAAEALEKDENISVTMRRHGIDPMKLGKLRSDVADEMTKLREQSKPKPSPARAAAMEKRKAADAAPPAPAPAKPAAAGPTPQPAVNRTSLLADIGMQAGTGRMNSDAEQQLMNLVGVDSMAALPRALKAADDATLQKAHQIAEADKQAQQERANKPAAPAPIPKSPAQTLAEEVVATGKPVAAILKKHGIPASNYKLAGQVNAEVDRLNESRPASKLRDEMTAALTKSKRRAEAVSSKAQLDKAITEAVGDDPQDREQFGRLMADSHKRLSEEAQTANDGMRQLLGQFGYSGQRGAGLIRAAQHAQDLDSFQRAGYPLDKMAQMIDSDPNTYAGMRKYIGGESSGAEDTEQALFQRLKAGGLASVPARHDPAVIEDALAQWNLYAGAEDEEARREREAMQEEPTGHGSAVRPPPRHGRHEQPETDDLSFDPAAFDIEDFTARRSPGVRHEVYAALRMLGAGLPVVDRYSADVQWVHAPKGGATSPVNKKFYEGGEFMPIHGKKEGQTGKKGKPQFSRTTMVRDHNDRLVEVPEGHVGAETLLTTHPRKTSGLSDQALDYIGLTRKQAKAIRDLWEEGHAYLPREVLPPSWSSRSAHPTDDWDIESKFRDWQLGKREKPKDEPREESELEAKKPEQEAEKRTAGQRMLFSGRRAGCDIDRHEAYSLEQLRRFGLLFA